jgi:hypothetical protein
MRKYDYAVLTLVALILAGIIAISPTVTTEANQSSTEIFGVDIFGLTRNAGHLPEEKFPAH